MRSLPEQRTAYQRAETHLIYPEQWENLCTHNRPPFLLFTEVCDTVHLPRRGEGLSREPAGDPGQRSYRSFRMTKV